MERLALLAAVLIASSCGPDQTGTADAAASRAQQETPSQQQSQTGEVPQTGDQNPAPRDREDARRIARARVERVYHDLAARLPAKDWRDLLHEISHDVPHDPDDPDDAQDADAAGGDATEPAKPAFPTPEPFSNLTAQVPVLRGVAVLGRDAETGDLGGIFLSSIPAAAGLAFQGRAGVGIAAVLGRPDSVWIDSALDRLAAGAAPNDAVEALIEDDIRARIRQVGVLAHDGKTAQFTGKGSPAHSAVLASDDVVIVMCSLTDPQLKGEQIAEAFAAADDLPLPERLLQAARACAQKDILELGFVSGRLLVLRDGSGPDATTDNFVDLRLDWIVDPLERLEEAYRQAFMVFGAPRMRLMQRRLDRESPIYESNKRWLKKLRSGTWGKDGDK